MRETMNDLRIYVSGGSYIECPCARWDEEDYSVIIETYLNKDQRDLLRNNIRPGAVAQLYQILGKPVYYDTSFGCNTITISPISGTQLANMHSGVTVYVKNYSERILDSNDFHVKITGYVSSQ